MRSTSLRLAAAIGATTLFAAGAFAAAPADRSPDGLWRARDARGVKPAVAVRVFRAVDLDLAGMTKRLSRAPLWLTPAAKAASVEVTLPMPDGTYQRFLVAEAPMMEPGLAEKFPEIRTYRGAGVDDPAAACALDVGPLGFHAQILRPEGRVLVNPLAVGEKTTYVSFFTRDAIPVTPFRCYFRDGQPGSFLVSPESRSLPLAASGAQLRTYRAAVAATGEYTAFCGGTVALGLAAITTSMNRVNQVYEQDVAIHMTLVANNNLIVYTNSATDPYTNGNPSSLLNQNQTNLDAVIGSANYDIGHVFSTAGGGLAALGVPCTAGQKAQGETGTSSPVGDAFDIDYVAHEMGHQFGANHTFNGTTGSCGGGNREATAAYEVGSGSTIMAYAGICGAEDLQPHSDPYFHSKSYDEIVAYTTVGTGNGCANTTATLNGAPVPNAGGSFTIPRSTPFTLTGSATDPNSDPLTYCWEEYDLGTAAPPNTDNGNRPIFRSFNPVPSPSRTFPKMADVLAGTATFGESMATTSRTMTFRLTARDNKVGGGGVDYASTTVSVNAAAGPFTVTAPLAAAVWNGGTTQSVTWNVASTTAAPVSCASVKVSLSSDGGATFPNVLLASTPNDGTEPVTVPTGITSGQGRVKVECATGNIFFNVNPGNFTLNPTPVSLQRIAAD